MTLYRAGWRWKKRRQVGLWSHTHLFTVPVKPYEPGKPSTKALCGVDVPESSKYVKLGLEDEAEGTVCSKCEKFKGMYGNS